MAIRKDSGGTWPNTDFPRLPLPGVNDFAALVDRQPALRVANGVCRENATRGANPFVGRGEMLHCRSDAIPAAIDIRSSVSVSIVVSRHLLCEPCERRRAYRCYFL